MKFSRIVLLCLVALAMGASSAAAATAPKVTSNYYFTCALLNSGGVKCWGSGSSGELGNGSFDPSFVPVDVTGISSATDIASGDETACVVLADTTVRCWGDNSSGQLGINSYDDSNVPVTPTGVSGAKQISGNDYTFCVATTSGTVKCWGSNSSGQLNTGDTADAKVPVDVAGYANVAKVSVGPDNVCALSTAGTVKCSGINDDGELGTGTSGGPSYTPVDVVGVSNAVDIEVGNEWACALISGGTVKCWGENDNGQLGIGSTDSDEHPTPTEVPGLGGVVSLSPGYDFGCALLSDATAKCWGSNGDGEAGGGSAVSNVTSPTLVPGLSSVVSLFTTAEHTGCAVVAGGTVQCWGTNGYGQAGSGDVSLDDVYVARAVPGLSVNVVPYAATSATLTQSKKSKLDKKKKNYTAYATLSVSLSPLVGATACSGAAAGSAAYTYTTYKTVKAKGKKKRKAVKKTKTVKSNAALAANGANCLASFSFKNLPVKYVAGKKLAVTASFAGNAALEPFSSSKLSIKLAKVKVTKKK
ncbi:MAG: hypothetical protein QM648_07240 [Solirubrobacterales bacterium]